MKSIGGTILLAGSFLFAIAPPAAADAVVTYHTSFGARAENIDSVQVLFDFSSGSSWHRMLDSVSRFSDNGLAEDPDNAPDVLPPVDSTVNVFLPDQSIDVVTPAVAASHAEVASADVEDPPPAPSVALMAPGTASLSAADNAGGGVAPGMLQTASSSVNLFAVPAIDPVPPSPQPALVSPPAPAAVTLPEPGTWLLILIGSVCVVLGSWRRRHAS